MLKIALLGYGKMGKAIEDIALSKGYEITLRLDQATPTENEIQQLRQANVAIEFSHPDSAVQNISLCFEHHIRVVSGTTGWLEMLPEVQEKCKQSQGAFLYSSNFSIGVNLFFELNKKLAALMKDHSEYEVSLEETHHIHKKDSPSGTAITLAEQILEQIPEKTTWVNEESEQPQELTIFSKRIDEVPGTHAVKYTSSIDDIEIIHTAHSRKGFAAGAVAAAEFLQGKTGIFTMQDVLGF